MTYSIKFKDVTAAVSNISISGVTVKDITGIPEQALMLCPLIFPVPNFVTNLKTTIDTLGTAGSERITLEYDINYIYAHCAINANVGGLYSMYSGLVTNIIAVLVAMLINDNPRDGVTMRVGTVSNAGAVNDPAGNTYWGCAFSLHVTEFTEVP